MLLIALAVVILSITLRVRSDQRVEFRFLADRPLPETCMSRSLWGVACPGCGLTRSFILMSRGQFADAFAVNRTGWLLAIAVLIQFPYRLYMLRQLARHGYPEPDWHLTTTVFSGTLTAALIVNWLLATVGL